MSDKKPVIPLKPVSGKPSPEALAKLDRRWRLEYLMLAPYRLGFFLAMVVLVASALWWALMQVSRVGEGLINMHFSLSPSVLHAAVMVFGFIPLFFSGFLFTAGPKWLGVQPWDTDKLARPLLLQAGGWLVWLAGGMILSYIAMAGLAIAWVGLVWMATLFWRLVLCSPAPDQVHARTIGAALIAGCLALGGILASFLADEHHVAGYFALTGLWGFVVVVYVTVAHRMIPFFTSSAMPFIQGWRPFWLLWLMLGAAVFEAAAVWVEFEGAPEGSVGMVWMLVRGVLELGTGAVLLWLAGVWGLVQSLKNRLLAMLHIGFLWLGLSFALGGVSQLLGMVYDGPLLRLGSLHALTMGCLGSLMLAMVTRVSCGHSGRALVADSIAWSLFWVLQVATVMRIVAAVPTQWSGWLLLVAATLWLGVAAVWGVRLGAWYGRLRADGRPG